MYAIPPMRPIVLPDLTLNGTPLPVVHNIKLLGVHMNSKLNWNDHIDFIVSKARRTLFILYRARQFGFSVRTMFTLYLWYIRTGLEYAAPVWHPGITAQQNTRLERIQKRCLRIILGDAYDTYAHAMSVFGCTTLEARRELLTLRFGRSLLRSTQHRHMRPPTLRNVHQRNTRFGHRLRNILCVHQRYQNSTIPYVVRMLNQEN